MGARFTIYGVEDKEEVKLLLNLLDGDIPLYADVGGTQVFVKNIGLKTKNFIQLNFISGGMYKIKYTNKDGITQDLDYSNPSFLRKIIKVGEAQ